MKKILVISNGHGEDFSGSLLGQEFKKQGYYVDAFSMVGKGNEYKRKNIKNYGFRKEFSTGGIGYTSLIGRLTELVQGQLIYLCKSFFRLLNLSKNYELVVVVGDVVPILAAWLMQRPSVVYLVAYSSYYEGKLRLQWPCNYLLSSKIFKAIYCRDQLSAKDLTKQLGCHVFFLGNPFMDPVFTPQKSLSKVSFRLGILPGSRRPELDHNLISMLNVLMSLPNEFLADSKVSIDIALVNSLSKIELQQLVSQYGWQMAKSNKESTTVELFKNRFYVNIHWNSFVKVVQNSSLIFAMAGTASEQSVGLAKPVVQMPGKGPQFTYDFAEAQRRLLGPTVFCSNKSLKEQTNLVKNTADIIMELYEQVLQDDFLKYQCQKEALLRLGPKGGTQKIVTSIIDNFFNINYC